MSPRNEQELVSILRYTTHTRLADAIPRSRNQRYSNDLTDSQWQAIKTLFDFQRKRKYDRRRDILAALFYLAKTGYRWRLLPREFAPWMTVYYFRRWKRELITRLHGRLRRTVRRLANREPMPSLGVIDGQSVKTTRSRGERGFDGGKLVKGRERHVAVDTLGLVETVVLHSTEEQDSQRAPYVLVRLVGCVPRLRLVLADQRYPGTPGGLIWRVFGWL